MVDDDPIQWLYSFTQYGWKLGLERISLLLQRLGNPHLDLRCLHVTGTNGKGSVCKFLASILQNAGYTVGLYVSPHLERFSERIVINSIEISNEDMSLLVNRIRPVVDELTAQDIQPTFFEIVTALAFQYFSDRNVDYVVVEVGLGGRFDATNVVVPMVSVITNISLEHCDYLGTTVESIAFEKAGIIKESTPVVTAASGAAVQVIQRVAAEKHAPVTLIVRDQWKRLSHSLSNQMFQVQGRLQEYLIETQLLGKYQGENIAVTLAVVELLQMHGVFITEHDIIEGCRTTVNPGRLEIISKHPLVVLDGAHNPMGIRMLKTCLEDDFSYNHLLLVLGILKDKDVEQMLKTIVPLADEVVVTKSENPRACEPEHLLDILRTHQVTKPVVVFPSIAEALKYAFNHVKDDDMICVTGSLFTVGEARSLIFEKYSEYLQV